MNPVLIMDPLFHNSVYNGLVGFASPLVTDREAECTSPVSSAQTSFAAGMEQKLEKFFCLFLFVLSFIEKLQTLGLKIVTKVKKDVSV